MKLLRTTLALIAVFLIFHLLYIGQTLLLPLVIATAVVYLINVLTHTICMLRIGRISLPRPIAMVFAIAVILASLSLVVQLVTLNKHTVLGIAISPTRCCWQALPALSPASLPWDCRRNWRSAQYQACIEQDWSPELSAEFRRYGAFIGQQHRNYNCLFSLSIGRTTNFHQKDSSPGQRSGSTGRCVWANWKNSFGHPPLHWHQGVYQFIDRTYQLSGVESCRGGFCKFLGSTYLFSEFHSNYRINYCDCISVDCQSNQLWYRGWNIFSNSPDGAQFLRMRKKDIKYVIFNLDFFDSDDRQWRIQFNPSECPMSPSGVNLSNMVRVTKTEDMGVRNRGRPRCRLSTTPNGGSTTSYIPRDLSCAVQDYGEGTGVRWRTRSPGH